MVIIQVKEQVAPPYANGFRNSVEQAEKAAALAVDLSQTPTVRASQCRELNFCFISVSFCLLQLETVPGIIADVVMDCFINKYTSRVLKNVYYLAGHQCS